MLLAVMASRMYLQVIMSVTKTSYNRDDEQINQLFNVMFEPKI